MSSITRKIERSIVRNKIKKDGRSVKQCFADEWKNHREKKYIVKDADGNIVQDNTPKNTMTKKQLHFDNPEQYFGMFAWADQMKKEKEENEKECVKSVNTET